MSNLTTETRRHGEGTKSGDRVIARDRVIGRPGAVRLKNIWVSAPAVLRNVARIARAVLREIFDESAYDRFLLRTANPRSVESYRAFLSERESAMVSKPRCC